MNIFQSKLTKQEWINIEIPPDNNEKKILDILKQNDKDIKLYDCININDFLKILTTTEWDIYIFNSFLKKHLVKINNKLKFPFNLEYTTKQLTIKTAEQIKITNLSKKIDQYKDNIFEFILLDLLKRLFKKNQNKFKLIFTLNKFINLDIKINHILLAFCKHIISKIDIDIKSFLLNYNECVKDNLYLEKFKHISIYPHQRTLFNHFNESFTHPKLVFYKISTGLGKTLSPIGLVKQYKVIFVCAAKHIGLALAKAAISQDIKIALAFECESKHDIRLHYNAATEILVDNKSGSIKKVNNLRGENVELVISDISSYLISMNYMKEFNKKEDIIFYWDEPTISLDYKEHTFHSIIKTNWQENDIPNIVLSSATLPSQYELSSMIDNFYDKFDNAEILEITNRIVNEDVYLLKENNEVFLPHLDLSFLQFKYFLDIISDKHILLKFLPAKYICEFITNNELLNSRHIIEKYTSYFKTLNDISIDKIREYYIYCCDNITNELFIKLNNIKTKRTIYKSSILVTSRDAHTITHGPAIFLTENIEKTAKIYFKKSNIDKTIIHDLLQCIKKNNKINDEVTKLQKQFEDIYNKENTNSEKYRLSDELKDLKKYISSLQNKIKKITIDDSYVPNKKDHFTKYNGSEICKDLFTSNLDEETILKVVLLDNVDNIWKILLLMGIGVFKNHPNVTYTEIIKKLAQQQRLFLIIASPDYIYGTNYNFCHGYISKDLKDITPEKTIQAIGRIGRKQQNCIYTMRFRDDTILKQIFLPNKNNIEAYNLNNLLS